MYVLGGEKGYVEKDYDYLIYFYTNENIIESYDEWRRQFKSLDEVAGIGKTLKLYKDPDQRDGQYPNHKYLLISAFNGDPGQMEKAIAELKLRDGNCVLFFKAVAPFYQKERQYL